MRTDHDIAVELFWLLLIPGFRQQQQRPKKATGRWHATFQDSMFTGSGYYVLVLFFVLGGIPSSFVSLAAVEEGCTTAVDCSMNGECQSEFESFSWAWFASIAPVSHSLVSSFCFKKNTQNLIRPMLNNQEIVHALVAGKVAVVRS